MNPYVMLGTAIGTSDAAALSGRLAEWHDAMVAHERALRAGRRSAACDDECPHVEARTLWAEAVATYGERAAELAYLRSRATAATTPGTVTSERNFQTGTGAEGFLRRRVDRTMEFAENSGM